MVLLKVALAAGTLPSLEQWKHWLLREVPSHLDTIDVSLEGTFRSGSYVMLVTLPIAVWDVLKNNDAYVFIDYVTSHNLLVSPHAASPNSGSREKREYSHG